MRIKRCPMTFHNILSKTLRGDALEAFNMAVDFRNQLLKNGLYTVSPPMFQLKSDQDQTDLTLYMSLNMAIEVKSSSAYTFDKTLKIDDGLLIRHFYMDEPLDQSYDLLREAASALNVSIDENFYHVCLDLYGEKMLDIYAQISGDAHD